LSLDEVPFDRVPVRTAIAVIGGGPAGAAAAITLARRGHEVLVIERLDAPRVQVGETLPPGIRPVLESLGVWSDFVADGHLPSVGNTSVWGSPEPRDVEFIFSPHGCGWHVDRRRFQAMLLRAAAAAGATICRGWELSRAEVGGGGEPGMRIELASAEGRDEVRARLVIDASGRSSALARSLGITRIVVDQLVGVVGYLAPGPGGPIASRATLIEAVEGGWWYSALLPTGELVVVYMTDADLVTAHGARTKEGWEALLGQSQQTRARAAEGGYRLAGSPQVVAAGTSFLSPLVGDAWLAAGDAAATYDPLSSQGILTALTLGIRAAEAAIARLAGDALALASYRQETHRSLARYLAMRASFYAMEKRWPESPFWHRRGLPV
jgi:flavin-dependent dehydrogenase